MKWRIYILLFISLSCFELFSAEPISEDKSVKDQSEIIKEKNKNISDSEDVRHGAALFEVVSSNVIFVLFNRYYVQMPYGYISYDSIKKNLTNSWVWDDDGFNVNKIGHPYQGSIYFTAARSNNVGFVGASLYTMAGSIAWEYFCETERPAINDLVTTTMGGIMFGEMFGRISDSLIYGTGGDSVLNQILAVVVSPVFSLNRVLFDRKQPVRSLGRVRGDLWTGVGMSTLVLKMDGEVVPDYTYDSIIADKKNRSIFFGFNVIYGSPYSYKRSVPFDYFELSMSVGVINSSTLLSLFSKGLLWGTRVAKSKNNDGFFGVFLNYDVITNALISLSSNSIGIGYQNRYKITNKMFFTFSMQLNFIVMGANDYIYFKYPSITDLEAEGRDYDFGMGQHVLVDLAIEKSKFGKVSINYRYYGFNTYPGSVPENGAKGYSIVGMLFVKLEKTISRSWSLGVMTYTYHKESFYEGIPDIVEMLFGGRVYTSFRF